MTRIFYYIFYIVITAAMLNAAPPSQYCRQFYAYVTVLDPEENPVSGVEVELFASLTGEDGDDYDIDSDYVYGTTASNGCVTLWMRLCVKYEIVSSFMRVTVTDDRYTVLSSVNTSSHYLHTLYPEFEVILDLDQNGINDDWELPLAEKFCPTLKLHHATEWIAPEPVEYLGVTKQDLWFVLYSNDGDQEADYPIYEGTWFEPPISYYYPWMYSSNPNYSYLSGDAYAYTGEPFGMSYARYYLRFHYNYAGIANTPASWISFYQAERNLDDYPHTIYAHLFLYNNKPVVQYWFYYPYNDGYNNHEGDWEHINVRIGNANPSLASIETIDFYFHNKVKTISSGYTLDDGTHPIVYVGGSCAGIDWPLSCEPGNATGGSYPWSGTWYNVGPFGYDEYVYGLGPIIPHENISVIVIPNPERIDFEAQPELSWLNVPIRWGVLEAGSPWDWVEPFSHPFPDGWVEPDVGNDAPLGPRFNDGWERVGAAGDYENY